MAEHDDEDTAAPRERRPLHVVAAAGWTIAATLLIVLAVQITESARPGAELDLVNMTACHTLAYSIVLFAMVRLYAPSSPMRSALGFRRVSPIHLVLSAIAGAGIGPALGALDELVAQRFPPSAEDTAFQARLLDGRGGVALIVSLVFVIPIAEEIFFRGILFGGLRRGRSAGAAMLLSAFLFAASRFDPRWAVSALVLGLVLAWLRAQSGSVVSSCVAHAAFFAMPLAPLVVGREPIDAVPLKWAAVAMAAAIAALIAGSFFTSRNPSAIAARADDE